MKIHKGSLCSSVFKQSYPAGCLFLQLATYFVLQLSDFMVMSGFKSHILHACLQKHKKIQKDYQCHAPKNGQSNDVIIQNVQRRFVICKLSVFWQFPFKMSTRNYPHHKLSNIHDIIWPKI